MKKFSENEYVGNLYVNKKSVSINTDIIYQGIEITFTGKMNISSLLPDDYMIKIGINKIIIVKMNQNDINIEDLFEYSGMAMIVKCQIVNSDLQKKPIFINKTQLQLWNTLKGTLSYGSTGTTRIIQDWAYLGENWEDIDFDGKNDKHYYQHRKTTYDKEARTYTTTKEIRKK